MTSKIDQDAISSIGVSYLIKSIWPGMRKMSLSENLFNIDENNICIGGVNLLSKAHWKRLISLNLSKIHDNKGDNKLYYDEILRLLAFDMPELKELSISTRQYYSELNNYEKYKNRFRNAVKHSILRNKMITL